MAGPPKQIGLGNRSIQPKTALFPFVNISKLATHSLYVYTIAMVKKTNITMHMSQQANCEWRVTHMSILVVYFPFPHPHPPSTGLVSFPLSLYTGRSRLRFQCHFICILGGARDPHPQRLADKGHRRAIRAVCSTHPHPDATRAVDDPHPVVPEHPHTRMLMSTFIPSPPPAPRWWLRPSEGYGTTLSSVENNTCPRSIYKPQDRYQMPNYLDPSPSSLRLQSIQGKCGEDPLHLQVKQRFLVFILRHYAYQTTVIPFKSDVPKGHKLSPFNLSNW